MSTQMTDRDYDEILDALYVEASAWGNCESPLHTLLANAYRALKELVDERRGKALLDNADR